MKFKDGKRQFRAIDVQILQPAEQPLDEIFLNAEELPLDVPESKSIVEPQSVLLKPANKKKTLLQIIQERKRV